MNQWINESMNQWTSGVVESMNQRTNESMTQWIDDSANQRINEPMDQWFREAMNQWTNAAMNQWIHGYQRVNEWTHELLDGWMNGWMDGWVSYFFVELLLHWTTSSLRCFFFRLLLLSEQPLIWAALSCLPATSSVASATQFSSLRSCYNALSNFQLQSCMAQE